MVGKSCALVNPATYALHAETQPGCKAIDCGNETGLFASLGPFKNVEYTSDVPVLFNSVTNAPGNVVWYAPAVVGKSETAAVPVT